MKITNFVAVRAGVVGIFARALNNLRSSAKEAMLVLRMTKGVLQVSIFGEITYAECSRYGENLRLAANGELDLIPSKQKYRFPRRFLALLFLLNDG